MNQENVEIKKEKKRINTSIVVGIILLLLVGVTFAYFRLMRTIELGEVTATNFTMTFTESDELLMTNAMPIYEEDIESQASYIIFSLNNSSNVDGYAEIYLSNMTIPDALKTYDFKWSLEASDNESFTTSEKITTGSFVDVDDSDSSNIKKLLVTNYKVTETKYFRIRVWLNETEKDQSSIIGSTFKAKVSFKGTTSASDTLALKILGKDNANLLDGEYNFDTDFTYNETDDTYTANYTDGLYEQSGDSTKSNYGYPTYYYRGGVTNNYVQLGTYKADVTNYIWEDEEATRPTATVVASSGDAILWRIVRINEDGSIKLISEYNSGNVIAYNSTGLANYINEDGTDSEIKSVLDTWYSTHITEKYIDSIIQYGDYCNDVTFVEEATGITSIVGYNSNAYLRAKNSEPIFTCSNEATMVNEKVGAITMDEAMYSGSGLTILSDKTSYLATNFYFTTLTPYNRGIYYDVGGTVIDNIFYLTDVYGDLNTISVQASNYRSANDTRPVITIKPDVTVKKGSGTADDPYILNLDY